MNHLGGRGSSPGGTFDWETDLEGVWVQILRSVGGVNLLIAVARNDLRCTHLRMLFGICLIFNIDFDARFVMWVPKIHSLV